MLRTGAEDSRRRWRLKNRTRNGGRATKERQRGAYLWDGSAEDLQGGGIPKTAELLQRVDTPTPPTRVGAVSRAPRATTIFARSPRQGASKSAAPPTAAAAAAAPITVSCGVDVGTSERFALADLLGGALGASDKGGGGGAFTTSLLLALASKYSELRSQMYSDGGEKEAAAPPPKERGGKARRGRKGDAAFTRWHSGVDDPKAPGSGDQLEPRTSPLPLWAAHPSITSEAGRPRYPDEKALELVNALFSIHTAMRP